MTSTSSVLYAASCSSDGSRLKNTPTSIPISRFLNRDYADVKRRCSPPISFFGHQEKGVSIRPRFPYECHFCNYGTVRSYNLKRHCERLHSTPKANHKAEFRTCGSQPTTPEANDPISKVSEICEVPKVDLLFSGHYVSKLTYFSSFRYHQPSRRLSHAIIKSRPKLTPQG